MAGMQLLKAFSMAWGWKIYAGIAAIALAAYLCGCFNGAVIVSKYFLRDDIRKHGSGNAGLTNFYRTFGGKLTLVVILTDVLKAVAALLIAAGIAGYFVGDADVLLTYAKYWAALFCLLGHMFPVMFGFRGGKGILSGGTIAIMLDWRIALVVWGGFLLLTFATRWVSLGSVWAGASFPFVTWFVYHDLFLLAVSVLLGILILWKHRGNIRRMLRGEESKLSLRKRK